MADNKWKEIPDSSSSFLKLGNEAIRLFDSECSADHSNSFIAILKDKKDMIIANEGTVWNLSNMIYKAMKDVSEFAVAVSLAAKCYEENVSQKSKNQNNTKNEM
jgi:hypothetical protein